VKAIQAIRGVRDILPPETVKWQRMESVARSVFERAGFREIRLPLFERTELFARGIGETTDIVEKEMYTFEDRSGESVTLRPEATASLLRAYIEHGLHVQPKPVRLYTLGPMFRYERPQAGRYRQFHQANVEALGEPHPALDAEVIGMLMEFFRELGLAERVLLRLNSIGDATCRPTFRERLLAYLRVHLPALCEECRGRVERNPLRVLDCKNPSCQPVIERTPSILESLCGDCRSHFDEVQAALRPLDIPFEITPRMVRGLDYYVRTTFEVVTGDLGAQNAVAGGGRYDGLIELLGGPADPGIGFAVGMERVALLLAAPTDAGAPVALLIPIGDPALPRLLVLAQALRRHGLPVELSYGARKLRSELDRANRLGVPYAVIVGETELEKGLAQLRDIAAGTQREVALDRLPGELSRLAEARRRG